ncbi:MAG: MBL fold metallo-hydrolase, partial [Bacteroides sp.]|nr:MBL fold metallo-hydrolase [Bacteroides sp.]
LYHRDSIIFSHPNIHILHETCRIELFKEVYLNVIETPGHDSSCLTYYTSKEIFTGDSFIPNIKTVTTFPRSNKIDAKISETRILQLSVGRNIYPGHGDPVIDFK